MSLYTLVFSDNSKYVGGNNYFKTKWLEIPDKQIRSIFYSLPSGDILCLTNFKKIYHYIDSTLDLSGKERGKTKVEYTYLLIERNNEVIQYKINIKTFDIKITKFNKEDNYIKKLNPLGWKRGI